MRTDRRLRSERDPEIYSDFDTAFTRNPVTASLARLTNEASVRQAIRNIIMTDRGHWPHHSTLGSGIKSMLFEPVGELTAELISDSIFDALALEPRITVLSLTVRADPSSNGYRVRMQFSLTGREAPVEFTDLLRRVR